MGVGFWGFGARGLNIGVGNEEGGGELRQVAAHAVAPRLPKVDSLVP